MTSEMGQSRRFADVRATSGFTPITAEKRTFRFGCPSTAELTERAVIHPVARPEWQRTKDY
jgi:hypothetical protein